MWDEAPGVQIELSSPPGHTSDLLRIAESLELVAADDPRIDPWREAERLAP